MHSSKKIFALSVVVAASASAVRAESAQAPDCRNGIFVEDSVSYSLAKITGEGKVFFVEDIAPCPNDTTACKMKSYLTLGDIVIAGRSFGGWRCVLYRDQKNFAGSAGYVPDSRIETRSATVVTTKDWLGTWRVGDDYIKLRKTRDGRLMAKGEAFWPSANPSPKEVPGGPHTGGMSGVATPSGNQVVFSDDEKICEVKLTLLPPFLLARDNGSCGGANVYFRGVFMRAR